MKEKFRRLSERIKAYRYVLLILAVGIFLLLLPEGKDTEAETANTQEYEETEWLADTEEQMEGILSRIAGVGELHLMLSVEQGMENRYAENKDLEESEKSASRRYETVILNGGSRAENALPQGRDYPVFRGASIVCEGGDVASVRLAVTETVKVLTGLSSDKISIVKGK